MSQEFSQRTRQVVLAVGVSNIGALAPSLTVQLNHTAFTLISADFISIICEGADIVD